MQHDWAVLLSIDAHVYGVQTLGQHEINLQRPALPIAPDGVAQHEIQLRTVERAVAGVEFGFQAGGGGGLLERRFGAVPSGIRSGPHAGPVGELDDHVLENQSPCKRS